MRLHTDSLELPQQSPDPEGLLCALQQQMDQLQNHVDDLLRQMEDQTAAFAADNQGADESVQRSDSASCPSYR